MTSPTLRQLDIFAQMIASGSIDACARELGVPRSEIQQDMAALEQRLGHRLFEVHHGQARLTEAGRTTVAAMQRLSETELDEWDKEAPPPPAPVPPAPPPLVEEAPAFRPRSFDAEALDEAEALDDAPSPPTTTPALVAEAAPPPRHGPLPLPTPSAASAPAPISAPLSGSMAAPAHQKVVIAAHPAIFSHFQDALDAFEQTNSDVSISLDLDTHTAAQAGPLLARGQADIAYFYALGDEGIESRYAWSEPLALYVGDKHPLAQFDMATLDDIDQIQAVMLTPGHGLRPLIDRALAKAGIAVGEPLMETDNLFDIMTLVRRGHGYFAAFGPLARDFARMAGIKRVPLGIALPAIDVRQAVTVAMRDDPVVASLSEYLFR